MGMYTEFHFSVSLKENTPKEVIDVLLYMLSEEDVQNENKINTPNHSLFETERWSYMLTMDSCSFSGSANSTLIFDSSRQQYVLSIKSSFKNYKGEIQKFIDWINPYIDASSNDFLGFKRYEESEEPTIIRKN